MRSTRLTAVALVAAVVAGGLALASPAQADPDAGAFRQLVGVGSDTTQDVLNALAGDTVNGKSYAGTAVSSGSARIASYDAVGSATITTRDKGVAFNRPNGSGNGRIALSASLSGSKYPNGDGVAIKGQVSFARSSGGPSASGTALTYIPMARDAVGVAARGSELQNLTVDQLHDIYSGTLKELNGQAVHPFIPQGGSGTRKFFVSALGLNDEIVSKVATVVQENQADDALKADGALVPFSVASWIAQNNGIAPDHSGTARASGAYLANIQFANDEGPTSPVTKVNGKLAPVAGYYDNATFGRDVYNVVPTRAIDPTSVFFDKALYDIFVTNGSHTAALASETAEDVIDDFGFMNEPYNGSISLARHAKQGGLEDGTQQQLPDTPAVKATLGSGSLKLSWAAPAADEIPVTDYRVLITRADGSVVVNKDLTATTTSYTATGLTAGTYSATLVANNLVGASEKPAHWTGAVRYASKTVAAAATTAYGRTPRIAVTVTGSNSVKPSGKVTVKEGSSTRGTAVLDSHGKASVALSSHLPVGTHTLTVSYSGNGGLNTSTATVRLTVTKATPAVSASHPVSVSHTKQAKVSVKVTASGTVPSGKVQIFDGSKVIATRTLSAGKTTVTLPKLKKGKHTLHVRYLGSSTVNARNGANFTIKST
ncbi:Ig-like domain repeat protein [Streptomyces sp. MI02-7b]|uniref:Ig-like domain repeat protein n=1 Tax=Streptomyces sp. MI02-7b TaxID=462941 RepID=UPI0029B67177|nr:Ig-like domain repeat protein [Streptomyces sp. MI02-7b]MDX3072278.1 Ig-like domain repeat protein [Streptomyces sp. MI02-7b]